MLNAGNALYTTRSLVFAAFLVLGVASAWATPWEVPIDGNQQDSEVARKLASKRGQIIAIEPIVKLMWDAIYQVNLSNNSAKIFTNLVTPERIDYWVTLDEPQFDATKMRELQTAMNQPQLQTSDPEARYEVAFTMPGGTVTWKLYPEAYDVLVKSTQDLRLPFVCRVVLLDKDNGILAMANEYLNLEVKSGAPSVSMDQNGRPYAMKRTVDFTKPVLYTWVQIAEQKLMETLGNKLSKRGFKVTSDGNASQVLSEMGGMSGSVEQDTEESFYGKNFTARQIRFWGLPVQVIRNITKLRVLRPTDTLLLYKGME